MMGTHTKRLKKIFAPVKVEGGLGWPIRSYFASKKYGGRLPQNNPGIKR